MIEAVLSKCTASEKNDGAMGKGDAASWETLADQDILKSCELFYHCLRIASHTRPKFTASGLSSLARSFPKPADAARTVTTQYPSSNTCPLVSIGSCQSGNLTVMPK